MEIVNEILDISITNDGEQHKDNNNSITQYIESNNDKILHLAENNYEDLVEVLTNNAINAAASSSNPTYHCLHHRHSEVHIIKVIPA